MQAFIYIYIMINLGIYVYDVREINDGGMFMTGPVKIQMQFSGLITF